MHKLSRLGAAAICTTALIGAPSAFGQQGGQPALDEIVVTGSFIRRSTFDSSSPVDFLGQDDFQRSAAISVRDIAQNLSYNVGSENFPDTTRSGATTGTENINLRGLGLNSTLVLMNGRRQAEAPNLTNDGVAFVDTASMMPTIAIERMEVLKDGAAALYGSDAISGVVNFITRNNFEGLEISIDHQSVTNYSDSRPNDWSLQGIVGFGNERGHVVAAASYLDRSPMPMYERGNTFAGGLSALGSPGNFAPTPSGAELQDLGQGGNLFSTRAASWQATTFDPNSIVGADLDCENVGFSHSGGKPTNWLVNPQDPDNFLPGDESCLYDFLPMQSLIDAEERQQFWAHFEYMLIPEHNVEVYGEFHSANNNVTRGNSPSYGFVNFPTVPVSNPGLRNDAFRRGLGGDELIDDAAAQAMGFANAIEAAEANPDVGPLLYIGRPFTGNPEEEYNDRGRFDIAGKVERNKSHFVGGVRGDLPFTDTWTFDLASTWSQHKFAGFVAYDTNEPVMQNALQGFGGRDCDPTVSAPGEGNCFFFNPFGSAYLADTDDVGPNGLYNADELWQHMRDPLLTSSKQELWVFDAVMTGDALELPAGPLGLAVGFQYRDQSFESIPSGTGTNFDFSFIVGQEQFDVERDVWAVFGEALVPLSTPDSNIGALELSLALRHEDYGGGTGSTTDPKVSFLWMPTDALSVRGSFQTSFKAPGLAQLGGSDTSLNNINVNALIDGADENLNFIPGIATGNPDLAPEEADVWNLGLSWQPMGALDGLEVDLDFWSFDFSNAIRKESNSAVVNAAAAGDQAALDKLTLNPDDTIALIRSDFINAASVKTEGIDLAVRYPIDTDGLGRFDLFWNSTHILEYKFQEGPDQPMIDGLGRRNFQTIGAPAPRWRANAGIDWFRGNHGANLTVRYTHRYRLDEGTIDPRVAILQEREVSDRVDRHITVDAQYSYQFDELFGMMGPTISVGAINVFNTSPPGIDTGPGYDSKIHDPRGRVAYASLRMAF